MFNHLRVRVAQPLLDFSFGRTTQKYLAVKIMAEAMQPPKLETDFAGWSWKSYFQGLNHAADELMKRIIGAKAASALGVENIAVGRYRK
jgi:hypothetical protein